MRDGDLGEVTLGGPRTQPPQMPSPAASQPPRLLLGVWQACPQTCGAARRVCTVAEGTRSVGRDHPRHNLDKVSEQTDNFRCRPVPTLGAQQKSVDGYLISEQGQVPGSGKLQVQLQSTSVHPPQSSEVKSRCGKAVLGRGRDAPHVA